MDTSAKGLRVRVGLEDSLWLGRGQLAKSNAEQVAKARRIIEEVGLQVATPNEARVALMGLRECPLLAESGLSPMREFEDKA